MKRSKIMWIIGLAALVLAAVIVLIWKWDDIGKEINELDYGETASVTTYAEPSETTLLTEPTTQQPTQSEAPSEQETDESTTEPTTTEPLPVLTVPPTESVEASTADPEREQMLARIQELIDSVYLLRDEYLSRLAAIEQDGINRYYALPEEERTEEKKEQIALSCVDAAYALEKECDAKIDTICAELGYLLMQTGSNQDLINEIRYVYASEKTAAKNKLMERYGAILG